MHAIGAIAIEHLRYHAWATQRILQVVEPLSESELHHDWKNSHASIWGALEHVFQADEVWLARHTGRPSAKLADFSAEPGVTALRHQWTQTHDRWLTYAQDVQDWEAVIEYRTSSGQQYRMPIFENILHLVNHGSYHRGQITTMLRQSGKPVVATDFLVYLREKKE